MSVVDLLIVWAGALVGAAIGAAIGYGLQLALGQAGWAVTLGAVGACGGALAAALWRIVRPLEPASAQQPQR